MESASVPVTLVLKASNQQFEDQIIECEPTWSVKKLKEHLAEVYPCKPRIDEQKLIYAGQLLTDKLVLKDVLRTYEEVAPPNHTMHLVYTPKMRQPSSSTPNVLTNKNNTSSNDGLRQRNIARTANIENTSTTASNIPQMASSSLNSCPNIPCTIGSNVPVFSIPNSSNEYFMAQQLAMHNWMQQAYVQYMNQYMNLLSVGIRPESVYMQNNATTPAINPTFGLPHMPYLPQNLSFGNNITDNSIQPNATPDNSQAAGANPQVGAVPQPAQPQPAQNEQPQPRFANLVQEELPENRDWLDIFYSFSRLLVLLTLVYFYSSPLRCLVVIFIGLAIYLYHIGFFRMAGEANNNNAVAIRENAQRQQAQQHDPANAAAQQINNNAVNIQHENHQPEENVALGPTEAVEGSSNQVPEAQNNGTSVIAFLRTFVVSFFVSLLPETPAL